MRRYAWVTLLSSKDYLRAVQVLAYSMSAVRSQYRLVVGITENILDESLVSQLICFKNVECVTIPTLIYGDKTQLLHQGKSVLNTGSKIALITLDYWDKLIYIDADTLVIENIDNLFDQYQDTSMIKYPEEKQGFTGLFVIEPYYHSKREYGYLKTIMQNEEGFDGDILGELWNPVKRDYHYQIPKEYLWFYNIKYIIPSSVKVIHYGSEAKPWILPHINSPFESIKLYQQVLKKVEEITNV